MKNCLKNKNQLKFTLDQRKKKIKILLELCGAFANTHTYDIHWHTLTNRCMFYTHTHKHT